MQLDKLTVIEFLNIEVKWLCLVVFLYPELLQIEPRLGYPQKILIHHRLHALLAQPRRHLLNYHAKISNTRVHLLFVLDLLDALGHADDAEEPNGQHRYSKPRRNQKVVAGLIDVLAA